MKSMQIRREMTPNETSHIYNMSAYLLHSFSDRSSLIS